MNKRNIVIAAGAAAVAVGGSMHGGGMQVHAAELDSQPAEPAVEETAQDSTEEAAQIDAAKAASDQASADANAASQKVAEATKTREDAQQSLKQTQEDAQKASAAVDQAKQDAKDAIDQSVKDAQTKENTAKDAADQASTAVDTAKQASEQAAQNVTEKQTAYDNAEASYTDAQSYKDGKKDINDTEAGKEATAAEKEAQDAQQAADTAKNKADASASEAKTASEQAAADKQKEDTKKQDLNQAQTNLNKAKDASNQADTADEEAKSTKAAADQDLTKAKEDLTEKTKAADAVSSENAQKAVADAQTALNQAEKDLQTAKDTQANADVIYKKGAYAFYEWVKANYPKYAADAQQAMDTLNQNRQGYKLDVNGANGSDAFAGNYSVNTESPYSLQEMQKAIQWLIAGNNLRMQDDNFKNLPSFRTTLAMTAFSQIKADISNSYAVGHITGVFAWQPPVNSIINWSENLAWGYGGGQTGPFDGWYTEEHATYNRYRDAYIKATGDTSPSMQEVENYYGRHLASQYDVIGHYTNTVADGNWIVGVGASQEANDDYGSVQSFDAIRLHDSIDPASVGMSLTEYQDLLNTYIATFDKKNLQSAVDTAQKTVNDKQKALNQAKTDLGNVEARKKAAQTAVDNAQEAVAAKQAAVDAAAKKLAEADTAKTQAAKAYSDAQSAYQTAKSAYDAAVETATSSAKTASEKQGIADADQAAYEAAAKTYTEKAATATEKRNAVNDLVNGNVTRFKNALDQAQTDLDTAKTAKETADQTYASAQTDLTNAQKAYEDAKAAAIVAESLDYDTIASQGLTEAQKNAGYGNIADQVGAVKSLQETADGKAAEVQTRSDALADAQKQEQEAQASYTKAQEAAKSAYEAYYEKLPDYTVVTGADSDWTRGENADLLFVSDGNFDYFEGITVDGVRVDPANYTVMKGSTHVILKHAYLNTLSTGRHTLRFLYKYEDSNEGGSPVEASFTIGEKTVIPLHTPSGQHGNAAQNGGASAIRNLSAQTGNGSTASARSLVATSLNGNRATLYKASSRHGSQSKAAATSTPASQASVSNVTGHPKTGDTGTFAYLVTILGAAGALAELRKRKKMERPQK